MTIYGCNHENKSGLSVPDSKRMKIVYEGKSIITGDVVNLGNNLFFFLSPKGYFGQKLSYFIDQHPELELLTWSIDGTGPYMLPSSSNHAEPYIENYGYLVTFKTKEIKDIREIKTDVRETSREEKLRFRDSCLYSDNNLKYFEFTGRYILSVGELAIEDYKFFEYLVEIEIIELPPYAKRHMLQKYVALNPDLIKQHSPIMYNKHKNNIKLLEKLSLRSRPHHYR